jgi:tape measure domain-containing protein
MSQEVVFRVKLDGAGRVVSDLKQVEGSVQRLQPAARGASNGLIEATNSTGGFSAATARLGGAAVAIAATAAAARQIGSAMLDSQVAAQKLSATLAYVAGGVGGATVEIDYLRRTSQQLGLDFSSASTAYARFAAATKESGISVAVTRETFEGVAKAASHLGLSADETNGALLALSQMASKGTVSAEELRGQLGERLPGAFSIAARAIGVTEQELGNMLDRGEVVASDFLPRFAAALNDQFAQPVNNATSELNRLSSAWDQFKSALFDGNAAGLFGPLTAGLSEAAAAMRQLGSDAGTTARLIAAVRGAVAGATGNQTADPVGRQVSLRNELTSNGSRIATLERSGLGQEGGLAGTFGRQELADLRKRRAEIESELSGLEERLRPARASALEAVNTTRAADAQRIANSLKAYLDDNKNESKAVRLAAAIDEENKAFAKATKGLDKASGEYAQAIEAHQRRVAEINARGATGGGRGGGVDLEKQRARQLAELQRQAEAELRAAAVMEQTVDRLEKTYQRQLTIYDERAMTEPQRALAAALRQVEEAADSARDALSAKAATLQTEDVVALEAYRNAMIEVNEQEEKQIALVTQRQLLANEEAERMQGVRRMQEAYQASSANMQALLNARSHSGYYTELESLRAEGNINRERLAQLEQLKAAYESLGEKGAAAAMQIQAQMIELSAHLDPVADKIRGIFEEAFEGFFNDLLDRSKSIKEAFKDLLKGLGKSFSEMIAKNASQELMKILGGGLEPGKRQGLFSFLGDLFVKNGPGSAGTDIASYGRSIFNYLSNIGGGGGAGIGAGGAGMGNALFSISKIGDAATTAASSLAALSATTLATEAAVQASAVSSGLADVSLAATSVSANAAAAGLASVASASAAESGGSLLSGLFGGGGSGLDLGGYARVADLIDPFAKGGAFGARGQLHAFASGGIVDRPTLFRFAAGGASARGLMGEAGPEAIMPLTRDGAGRLGVRAQGGASGDHIAITINLPAGANGSDLRRAAGSIGREVASAVGRARRFT